MITITVPRATVKAMLVIAVDADTRCTGVCVDYRDPLRPVMVTTDGHRLLAALLDRADPAPEQREQVGYVIPTAALQAALRNKPRSQMSIDLAAEKERTFAIQAIQGVVSGTCQADPYPLWRRLFEPALDPTGSRRYMNTQGRDVVIDYDWTYLGSFAHIARILGADTDRMTANGRDAAIIELGPRHVGLLMPLYTTIGRYAAPAWAAP
jgi:hypothetical protein